MDWFIIDLTRERGHQQIGPLRTFAEARRFVIEDCSDPRKHPWFERIEAGAYVYHKARGQGRDGEVYVYRRGRLGAIVAGSGPQQWSLFAAAAGSAAIAEKGAP